MNPTAEEHRSGLNDWLAGRISQHRSSVPNGVRDLKLWQEAVALAADILRLARHGAKRDSFAFLDRLTATAAAVPEAVADGYSRDEACEQQRQFAIARISLVTLETQLAIARRAGILPADASGQLATRLAAVSRLLSGYLTYVERQHSSESEERASPMSPRRVAESASTAAPPLSESVNQVDRA